MTTTIDSLTIAPAGAWQLDRVHSSVGFEIAYLGGTFKGGFRDATARLSIEDGKAQLAGSAQVGSVDVKDESLAAHLQSPDFLDAEQHPELRFTAEDVALGASQIDAEGEITIKGVTKPVHVTGTLVPPITDPSGRERVGLKLGATVDRTEFGVSWNMSLPTGEPALSDDVTIDADLYFVREP